MTNKKRTVNLSEIFPCNNVLLNEDTEVIDYEFYRLNLYCNSTCNLQSEIILKQEKKLNEMIHGYHGIEDVQKSYIGSNGIYCKSYVFKSSYNRKRFVNAFEALTSSYKDNWSLMSVETNNELDFDNLIYDNETKILKEFVDNEGYGLLSVNNVLL